MDKIVFVSGPSGMGKTKVKEKLEALSDALGIDFERVIIDTSRDMRPGESKGDPWYFRKASEIEDDHNRDPGNYLKVEIRKGEPQGLDANTQIREKLDRAGVLWCELHVTWFEAIKEWLDNNMSDVKIVKVFFTPLSEKEILARMAKDGCSWQEVIETEVLRRLVARREANLDNTSLDKLQKRAESAVDEVAKRNEYDCVIVNHQGEESPQWGEPTEFPTGEAASVLGQFLQIYKG